jgi:hypothetical protein
VVLLRVVGDRLGEHVASCRAGYAAALAAVLAGLAVGAFAVRQLPDGQRAAVAAYLPALAHPAHPAWVGLAGAALVTEALWAGLGCTVVGLPVVWAALGLRSVAVGFTAALLVDRFGPAGVRAVVLALAPSALPTLSGGILAVAALVRAASGVRRCLRHRRSLWWPLAEALPALVAAAAVWLLGAWLEAAWAAHALSAALNAHGP